VTNESKPELEITKNGDPSKPEYIIMADAKTIEVLTYDFYPSKVDRNIVIDDKGELDYDARCFSIKLNYNDYICQNLRWIVESELQKLQDEKIKSMQENLTATAGMKPTHTEGEVSANQR